MILVLILLLLLFGGGGYYFGGPHVGGGLGLVILIILVIVLVRGGLGMYLLVPTLALTMMGCATGATISFPVGAFALMYADAALTVRTGCAKGKIPVAECAKLQEYDKEVREKLTNPKKELDWQKVGEMLGQAAQLAKLAL